MGGAADGVRGSMSVFMRGDRYPRFSIIHEVAFERGLTLEAMGLLAHIQFAGADTIDTHELKSRFVGYDVDGLVDELTAAGMLAIGPGMLAIGLHPRADETPPHAPTFNELEERPPQKSGVYVIQAGDAFKIGVTRNLARRMKGVQTGSPHPLNLIWYKEFREAAVIEARLHSMLDQYRVSGEWFRCSIIEIQDASEMVWEEK